jgi:hypothetical protein
MYLVICPGIHEPGITTSFLDGVMGQAPIELVHQIVPVLIPTAQVPPFSAPHILQFLQQYLAAAVPDDWQQKPIVFLGFSAGVVGASGASWGWQLLGGKVKALIALDGWGVPLTGEFPIHRLSHDYFTHWSSALLGAGADSFYADPAVEHLALWRSPHTTQGFWLSHRSPQPIPTTAAAFLVMLLQRYGR